MQCRLPSRALQRQWHCESHQRLADWTQLLLLRRCLLHLMELRTTMLRLLLLLQLRIVLELSRSTPPGNRCRSALIKKNRGTWNV